MAARLLRAIGGEVEEDDETIANREKEEKMKELRKYARNRKYETEFSFAILKEALYLEHESAQTSLRRFRLANVKIIAVARGEYYFSYLNNRIPPGFDYLTIVITPRRGDGEIIYGTFKSVKTAISSVYFTTTVDLNTDKTFNITYETNRFHLEACLGALNDMERYRLEEYFMNFNETQLHRAPKRNIKGPSIREPKVKKKSNKSEWFNEKIDVDQKAAVLKILSESAYPFPFVVTGGSGTGKTSVLIETVLQILHKKDRAHILITCQSNSACDEIGVRLLKFVEHVKVFRYYAYNYFMSRYPDSYSRDPRKKNFNKDCYFEILSQNSTIRTLTKTYQDPTVENFLKFKIVIATMTTVHHIKKRYGCAGHFDFVFIDECCAATEPECLIPIIGLAMIGYRSVFSNIILIGDDKLLGPVLNDYLARGLGLEQSLLERMLRLDLYKPKDTSERIVRLTINYRSHPEIFRFSNKEFYSDSMESRISSEDYNFAMNWKQLPNPDVPIIFDVTKTESKEEADGVSLFNDGEVAKAFEYVENLINIGFSSCSSSSSSASLTRKVKQEQIGIVTPYTGQVKKLRAQFENYPKIDIGTTEFFQGREKPVMIISAVRTENLNENIDFLDNPRRINVLLTRAKSLMIIIGNIDKLCKFPSWQPFINHCLRKRLVRRGALQDAEEGEDVLMERLTLMRIIDSASESSESEDDLSSDES